MTNHTINHVFILYLKACTKKIIINTTYIIIFFIVFYLYSIPFESIIYAFTLIFLISFVLTSIDFIRFYHKVQFLQQSKQHITEEFTRFPKVNHIMEEEYQDIIKKLQVAHHNISLHYENKQIEMIDYYTLWVHQIKTPIAAMRLLLQSETNEMNQELIIQLTKIEQYVEMVLGYLKIENNSSDLVLQHYDLKDIVKQGIRKYANLFIRKNIKLVFNEKDCIVLTDEKWLSFVFEQILFNALKYTSAGSIIITIHNELEKTSLIIQDTGVGIAQEDIHRVFDKGFTGYNGRLDKKATGLGLYLCKKVLSKLSHQISIRSEIGIGTTVTIDLLRHDRITE